MENMVYLANFKDKDRVKSFAWHIWLLWFDRNKRIHEQKEVPIMLISKQARDKQAEF